MPINSDHTRGATVNADADRGKARIRRELGDQPQPQPDRRRRTRAPKHESVPDRLHVLRAVLGEQAANPSLKVHGHLERAAVSLGLGERREPDQIGEQEGVVGGRHSDTARYLKHIPTGMSS